MKHLLDFIAVAGYFASIGLLAVQPAGASESARPAAQYRFETCGASSVRLVGFSDALNKTSFGGFAVSELSGISYDRASGRYRAVADRAGAIQSHIFDLAVSVEDMEQQPPAVTAVTVLTTPGGDSFTGANLDAEGLVTRRDGTVYVASEGGSAAGEQPEVLRFSESGTFAAAVPVPAKFLIGTNNVSFESLTESPGGHDLFTANEAPLAADGRTSDLRSRIRITRFSDNGSGPEPNGEFFYLTEPGRTTGDLGIAELLAVSPSRLLVLERGFVVGRGNTIRIFEVSLAGAQDVSAAPSLAAEGLEPMTKSLLVDLGDCPPGGATVPPGATQPNPLLENFEAMTFGPDLPGGMRSLVLLSDDNGSAGQSTRVVVLGIPRPLLTPAE